MQMKVHCNLVHVRAGGVATSVAGVHATFVTRMVTSTGFVWTAAPRRAPHVNVFFTSNLITKLYVMLTLQDSVIFAIRMYANSLENVWTAKNGCARIAIFSYVK